LPEGERLDALERHLREQVASVLEIEPRRLDPNRPVFEMGLTSVRAVEIRNALSAGLGTMLPATLLFDHPTLAALTSSLAQEILGHAAPEDPEPVSGAQRLMLEIEQLSDEEAAALLAGSGS
jgi:aryl carrier-like protein